MNHSPTTTSQSVTIKDGAISQLEDLFVQLHARKIFFVVDKPAYTFSGAEKKLRNSLKFREVTWFSDFELNPKIEDVERGVKLFRDKAPDVVLALGGGSALDVAKLIAGCGAQSARPDDYVTGKITLDIKPPPVIAIPTTSGTGSEATHFAVVYIDEKKYSLASPYLLPDYVLIDPQLTHSLPSSITAACGLDALCQSMESIWAVGATGESIKYASEGLKLALNHLEKAVCNPCPDSRMAMALAAHLSGKAINISKTTAPHAVSYGITTRYRLPHGMAVALTLGAFLEYNSGVDEADCTDQRGPEEVRRRMDHILDVMDCTSIEQARNCLGRLMAAVGCSARVRDAGIVKADLATLAGMVNTERLSNNPRRIDVKVLETLLEDCIKRVVL